MSENQEIPADDATANTGQVDGESAPEAPAAGATEDDANGEDALGDAGKKALASMKEREKAARAETRELKKQLEELKAQAASKDKSEDEKALEEARRKAESEAMSKANERILKSELKAAATGKLADPKDVLAFLDLTEFEVDDNGEVNTDDISDAINKLLEEKPHLAAQGGKAPKFDSGRGKTPTNQITNRADLAKMSPEQIEAARKAGRLDSLLGK